MKEVIAWQMIKRLKPEEQTKNDPAASEQQTPGKDTPPLKRP